MTFAYFAAASWPLVRAYAAFAGTTLMAGCLVWIVAAVVLALPLTFAWTRNRTAAALRIPIALAVGVLPPFGLIGWASPVAFAGVLFPGTAYGLDLWHCGNPRDRGIDQALH